MLRGALGRSGLWVQRHPVCVRAFPTGVQGREPAETGCRGEDGEGPQGGQGWGRPSLSPRAPTDRRLRPAAPRPRGGHSARGPAGRSALTAGPGAGQPGSRPQT